MSDTVRRIFFPYCIKRLADGRHIILNRNYKPLGEPGGDFIDYGIHPSATSLKITPSAAKKISWNGSESTDDIYLYDDGCIPTDGAKHMRAYTERLAVLMKLKTGAS